MPESPLLLLQQNPAIALFLALTAGYAFGRVRFGPIQLGGVCGTLLAALLIGNFVEVQPAPGIKSLFFALFIFALGYAGGPQFFANLNAKGLRLGLLCAVEVAAVLALVMGATWLFGLDQGTAAGLMAGAATESAVVGTASDAVSKLPLAPDLIQKLQANVVTAYSITYVFGLIAIVIATSQLFPLLLKINLRKDADALLQQMGGLNNDDDDADLQAAPEVVGRIYRIDAAAGKRVADIEAGVDGKASIERVRRHGKLIDATPELVLQRGDAVLLTGQRDSVLACSPLLGPEVAHVAGLDFAVEIEDIVFNRRDLANRALGELRREFRRTGISDGVHLLEIRRLGEPLPLLPDLRLQPGDVVRLQGSPRDIAKVSAHIGQRIDKSDETDFTYAGLGIVLGILVGALGVKVGGVNFSLGTGGGALLSGLLFGWFQALRPGVGHIPASAIELMKDLGLAMFIACVGLSSGPQAMALVKSYGIALPITGVLIALVPATLSLLLGRFILKLDSPVLLGAIAGQQCSTPALSAVVNAAGNTTPLLGYTITYAISNIVLPLMGPLIIFLAGQIVVH
ncbi:aspartate-alanine antiporter [Jeongeupia chitinilytica]|uniref:Aspartate-alanine antiporter n=1 Tax=Jeongeupia chitinilytica TaxID=1041641 RepID=A0ABQ3H856_9NEIS|nr:aspartate-alanine antiporter [Jeongeupia chitinilytica]GHD69768.1 aspartate-alanine antiporter [Jeongeupia chitinilytica]